ncbi:zf-HC2 domain-containing protein [Massilicoli timonensis]|uniref:zf-HC2 domain-containing protein n=1 Tax=Massilicoli timonensis TaxID=2015901 RepID=UPI003AACBCC5
MRNECNIIHDILPLYAENIVSEDTAEFVKEHLESCPACREELEKLRVPVDVRTKPQLDMNAAPLKRLKKALLMKKVQTILCTAAVLLALMLSFISFLTAPKYFTYSSELVTVTEEASGAVTLSFSNEVTNYKLQQVKDPDERQTVYHLEAWTSAWDRMFHKPGAQAVTVTPENGKPLLVYFTQFINGHAESSNDSSVCIYGTVPDSGGWVALAGLSLGYWLLLNIALFLILAGIWFMLRRKERPRRRVERLLIVPVAYGLGHLCVMGFRTVSYSVWRDFQLILATGVLFYCAMLLALSLFYSVKELAKW